MVGYRLIGPALVIVLLGGCGGSAGGGFPGIDTAILEAAESQIAVADAEAASFEELRVGEGTWEDVLGFVEATYAPEIVFDDVTFNQRDEGHEAVARMYQTFLFYMNEATITHRPMIVGDGTVVSVIDFSDVTLGPASFTEGEPLVEVDLLGITEGRIASNTLFYDEASIGSIYGEEPLFDVVEQYLAAWSSGDPGRVAELYAAGAVRRDGLAQVEAVGRTGIESEAERWFDRLPDATWEVVVPFAQRGGDHAGVVFDVIYGACTVTMAVVWEIDADGRIAGEVVHYDPVALRRCEWVG